jgi:hypothetical protein
MKLFSPRRHVSTATARLALVIALLSGGCAVAPTIEQRYDTFHDFVHSSPIEHAVADLFEDLFSLEYGYGLTGFSTFDLELLFDAANYAVRFDAHNGVERQLLVLEELERRETASRRHYAKALNNLVLIREFPRAEALYQRAGIHHNLVPPPKFSDSTSPDFRGPTELTIGPAGELVRRPVDLTGSHIVVTWHPACHFSRRAYSDITVHPILSNLLRTHGKLLAPIDSAYDSDDVRRWNLTHQDAPVTVAYLKTEWPIIPSWELPTFNFLIDGKLVATVIGWPPEGKIDQLLQAAHTSGMLSPSS